MAQVDLAARRVALKIVYCGPAMSGKTTNVRALYSILPESRRGELRMIEDENKRTVFFDFTPIDARTSGGYEISFRVYSVSGHEEEADSRAAVLTGVDGVVFVADAAEGRVADNVRSMSELRTLLQQLDATGEGRVPVVVQYNKLDLASREHAETLRSALEQGDEQVSFASAAQNRGVVETFESVCRLAAAQI